MCEKTVQRRFGRWPALLILCLFTLSCSAVLAGESGGDSPQAVFEAAQAAGAQKDFAALASLVAPTEQAMLAFGTDMAVNMFVEFYEGENAEALKKKYQEIQDKYEIKSGSEDEGEKLEVTQDTPQEVIDEHIRKRAARLYGDVDAVKYVPDLMGIIVNMPEMAEQSFFPQEALSELKIDGDIATGKAGDKEITFIRKDGRWYLSADVMN